MKQRFISLLYPGDGTVDVIFPDFPGCVTQGDTMEGALHVAAEALCFHISGMVADGEPLPAASTLDSILADPETEPGSVAAYIETAVPGKTVPVNVSMDENLVKQIEAVAGKRGRSRFLADAARRALTEQRTL